MSDVGSMREERRVVTAVAADIVGSTAIGERLDPEDARDIVGGAVARMIGAIERLGGTIKDLAGDGVLALFGAPSAHEDDAERAILSGLHIVDAVRNFSKELPTTQAFQGIDVRVGIETGLAVLGPIGAGSHIEYGAVGDVINVASRLQSHAPPGTVIVGDRTRRLVETRFEWGRPEKLALKGKAHPVVASRAVRPLRPRGRTAAPVASAQLVGRVTEMRTLSEAVERLGGGHGSVVFITGDPGVGKSRLIEECRALTTGVGAMWLEGTCRSYSESLPYALYRDLLLGWMSLPPDASPERVATMLRKRARRLAFFPGGSIRFLHALLGLSAMPGSRDEDVDPEQARNQTFRAAAQLLEALAEVAPLVVVLEDLHWADPTSVELTAHLGALPTGSPILFLVTYRPMPDDPSVRLQDRVVAGLRLETISLAPLSREGQGALLYALLGPGTLPPGVEERVLATTEGNPFFLEEQARAMAEAGLVVNDGRGWRFEPRQPIEVPSTIEKVILARVDRLPARARELLVTCSVLGREFTESLLDRIVESNGWRGPALAALEAAGLVETAIQGQEPGYRFTHALIQETAYRTILKRRLREVHGRVAVAMEKLAEAGFEEPPATIAHHLAEAGEHERAIPYLVSAGHRARTSFAMTESVESYRKALALMEALGPDERAGCRTSEMDVLESLGSSLETLGRYEEARSTFEQAIDLQGDHKSRRLAALHRKLASVEIVTHRYDQAITALDRGEEALGPSPSREDVEWFDTWLDLQGGRVAVMYYRGDVAAIQGVIDRIGPIVGERGSPNQRCEFFGNLLIMSLRRDRFVATEQTLAYARACLDAAEEAGDPSRIALERFTLGFTLLWHGDSAEAEQPLRAALEEAQREEDADLISRAITYIMVARRKQGDVEGVRALVEPVTAAAQAGSLPEYQAMAEANRAWVAWRDGDVGAAERHGRSALERWEGLPVRYVFDWMAAWPLLAISVQRGDLAEAAGLGSSMLIPSQQPLPEPLRRGVEDAVHAADGGDLRTAARALQNLFPLARELAYL